jgi:cyclic pyranopterin phosphate synthase
VTVSLDALGRPLASLRISVTDRCNLRCAYCMPEDEYVWLPSSEILSFEELSALVDRFATAGVNRVRLTGGEPLIRKELPTFVSMLAAKGTIEDLALTTNGVLLAEQAEALRAAGLHRITVSLDTLDPARFAALTRRDLHARVLEGIAAARFPRGLKLDTVVIRGINDDDLAPLLEFAARHDAELRFIEYMDVGGATKWSRDQVVSRAELLQRLSAHYGPIAPVPTEGRAPAERFRLPDGRVFGIIASTTAPFCRTCDRSRLTADGRWLTCLYAETGLDLKTPLRAGAGAGELDRLIASTWRHRKDRGAEDRLALLSARGGFKTPGELRADPHLEMHTRGG